MRRIQDKGEAPGVDPIEHILWAIVDGQAKPGWHRRARHLLGSRASARAALGELATLDRRLKAWARPDPVPTERATLPAQSALVARPVRSWLQRILKPSSVLRLAQ